MDIAFHCTWNHGTKGILLESHTVGSICVSWFFFLFSFHRGSAFYRLSPLKVSGSHSDIALWGVVCFIKSPPQRLVTLWHSAIHSSLKQWSIRVSSHMIQIFSNVHIISFGIWFVWGDFTQQLYSTHNTCMHPPTHPPTHTHWLEKSKKMPRKRVSPVHLHRVKGVKWSNNKNLTLQSTVCPRMRRSRAVQHASLNVNTTLFRPDLSASKLTSVTDTTVSLMSAQ